MEHLHKVTHWTEMNLCVAHVRQFLTLSFRYFVENTTSLCVYIYIMCQEGHLLPSKYCSLEISTEKKIPEKSFHCVESVNAHVRGIQFKCSIYCGPYKLTLH